jgi:hypothetical protein
MGSGGGATIGLSGDAEPRSGARLPPVAAGGSTTLRGLQVTVAEPDACEADPATVTVTVVAVTLARVAGTVTETVPFAPPPAARFPSEQPVAQAPDAEPGDPTATEDTRTPLTGPPTALTRTVTVTGSPARACANAAPTATARCATLGGGEVRDPEGGGVEGGELEGGALEGGALDGGGLEGGGLEGGGLEGGGLDGGGLEGGGLEGGGLEGGGLDEDGLEGGVELGGALDGGALDGGASDGLEGLEGLDEGAGLGDGVAAACAGTPAVATIATAPAVAPRPMRRLPLTGRAPHVRKTQARLVAMPAHPVTSFQGLCQKTARIDRQDSGTTYVVTRI